MRVGFPPSVVEKKVNLNVLQERGQCSPYLLWCETSNDCTLIKRRHLLSHTCFLDAFADGDFNAC